MFSCSEKDLLKSEISQTINQLKNLKKQWIKPGLTLRSSCIDELINNIESKTAPLIQKIQNYLLRNPSKTLQKLLLSLYITKKEIFDALQKIMPPTGTDIVNTKIRHQRIIMVCDDAINELEGKKKSSTCAIS